ncbi:MAG: AmmeMemoRadiSam system radical SAM enzyme [Clostridia bacterium]|jgi:pyruvate formate lyase activating enzyme|nr:AmmeMemoRadiSam system radical SAM enzyme [Clostridia bacterium]
MPEMHEAQWYRSGEGGRVLCDLCPHCCQLAPGQKGICRVRENHQGKLVTRNYALCSPLALDPIEKKPLYHFFPGSTILSTGTVGCNFRCQFCQNWQLAHGEPSLTPLEPGELTRIARREKDRGCIGIAYTYSEPLVWYEYVLEEARISHEQGLKNVLVTNGFINEEPLEKLLPVIDAFNIDVKAFNRDFYRKLVKGDYRPVLRTAQKAREAGCHVEVTNLLVPGLNDGEEEIRRLVDWLAGTLGPDTPLHFSRYFPHYQLDLPPTPLETLAKAKELAEDKLRYVYLGNAPQLDGSDTYCPHCGEKVIGRSGYWVNLKGLDGNHCRYCRALLPIIAA